MAPTRKQYDWPVLLPGEIVCHGDVGRHNTVSRDGLPAAFIDVVYNIDSRPYAQAVDGSR